jgi:hypothetical protein
MLLFIGGDDQFGLGDLRLEAIDLGSGFGNHLSAVGVAGFDFRRAKRGFSRSARDATRSRNPQSLTAPAGCNHTVPNRLKVPWFRTGREANR